MSRQENGAGTERNQPLGDTLLKTLYIHKLYYDLENAHTLITRELRILCSQELKKEHPGNRNCKRCSYN